MSVFLLDSMLERVDWKRIAKFFFLFTLFSLGGGMILMSHFNKIRLQEEKRNYKIRIFETRKENDALRKEKTELQREDSEATKRELRKEGFVKEGEKIVKFSK